MAHHASAAVQQHALAALANLVANNDEYKRKAAEPGVDAILHIVTTMQGQKYNEAVLAEGMRALLNLTTTIPDNAAKAVAAGAMEATVRGGDLSWISLVVLLAASSCLLTMGKLPALCARQVDAMKTHPYSAVLQEHGGRALAALTCHRKVRGRRLFGKRICSRAQSLLNSASILRCMTNLALLKRRRPPIRRTAQGPSRSMLPLC